MKLITFQTRTALTALQKTGLLVADTTYIDLKKYGVPYHFIVQEMQKRCKGRTGEENYPLWAWAKCGGSISPPKKKNADHKIQDLVKITFEKPDHEVLLSDYMAYSFILSGHIVPKTQAEYQHFLQKIAKAGLSLDDLKGFVRHEKKDEKVSELFLKIKETWPRIFDLKSTVRQACVWNIQLSEVVKTEILNDANYLYGTMNAKRKDGTRPDWKKVYLKFLR